ncbi:type II toxin-antitoxin system HicB family antitoxin [Geminocystis herdmanii]|uniref:type II toxin-antitoxin system HicB family antitoxin n=1 Tax=Geminocystis herdmanii TaxID=669359 RepID=UPI00034D0EDA|nr:type II toxin-antitoxin system HicB family antitoxin [Geminocystis herdmanii]
MSINNYDFDGFTINLYVDENGDWLCHFVEMPNISAFGDTSEEALIELQTAWEMVKEDFIAKGLEIPIAPRKLAYS